MRMICGVLVVVAASCGHDRDAPTKGAMSSADHKIDLAYTPPRAAGAIGTSNLTFQPNVHMVEQKEGAAALVAESSNGHGLVFDVSNAQITSLKAGDVLVMTLERDTDGTRKVAEASRKVQDELKGRDPGGDIRL